MVQMLKLNRNNVATEKKNAETLEKECLTWVSSPVRRQHVFSGEVVAQAGPETSDVQGQGLAGDGTGGALRQWVVEAGASGT